MLTGRKKELQHLQRLYEKSGSQFVVIYGQRGVGKTRLIKEFVKSGPCFYYVCREASEREQQAQWGKELADEGIILEEFPAWKELFAGSMQGFHKKQVLILDEFQNLVKNGGSFAEELADFVEELSEKREVLVILVSSSISWVENSMVRKMGRAAHRISALLKIKPLGFFELREAFSGFSAEQAFGLYAVLGGNPGLWKYMSPTKSLKENICDTILSPTGALNGECRRILSGELRELGIYQTILSALAGGHHKLNEIYVYTGFSRAKISVYLKNLMERELIEKVFSYDTEGRENMQKGVYRICNHFVDFYFTFLYPAGSRLELVSAETFYEKDIVPVFRRFMSYSFKEVCREYLLREAAKGQFPFKISTMGEWAGKAGDIDIIAQSEAGETLLAICQCERDAFPYEDYEWMLFLAKQARLKADYIWLFTDREFDERLMAEARGREDLSLILL